MGKCCSVLGNANYLSVLPLRGNPLPYPITTISFHFVLFEFKDLVAKQHPITHWHMYIYTYIHKYIFSSLKVKQSVSDTTIGSQLCFQDQINLATLGSFVQTTLTEIIGMWLSNQSGPRWPLYRDIRDQITYNRSYYTDGIKAHTTRSVVDTTGGRNV